MVFVLERNSLKDRRPVSVKRVFEAVVMDVRYTAGNDKSSFCGLFRRCPHRNREFSNMKVAIGGEPAAPAEREALDPYFVFQLPPVSW